MSDASTPQLNFATKRFHVDSLVVRFSSFFSCLKWFKIWFDVFHPTNLMNMIFKEFDQTKMFQVLLYTLPNLNLIQNKFEQINLAVY